MQFIVEWQDDCYNKLGSMRKEVIVVCFEIPSQNLPEGTEKTLINLS